MFSCQTNFPTTVCTPVLNPITSLDDTWCGRPYPAQPHRAAARTQPRLAPPKPPVKGRAAKGTHMSQFVGKYDRRDCVCPDWARPVWRRSRAWRSAGVSGPRRGRCRRAAGRGCRGGGKNLSPRCGSEGSAKPRRSLGSRGWGSESSIGGTAAMVRAASDCWRRNANHLSPPTPGAIMSPV
jgi:hypothetical protein